MKPLQPIISNTTQTYTVKYTDKEGTPVDLTGASALLVLRKNLDTAPIAANAGVINVVTGEVVLEVLPSDTADILGERDKATYLIGATLTLANGRIINLFQLPVVVKQNIVSTS